MNDINYVSEDDIRDIVNDTCEFNVEDWGIGNYEYGNGKYFDTQLHCSLVSTEIMVEYPVDTDSVIYTRVQGIYYLTDGDGMDFECDWVAELNHIEWNHTKGGFYEATYEVFEG